MQSEIRGTGSNWPLLRFFREIVQSSDWKTRVTGWGREGRIFYSLCLTFGLFLLHAVLALIDTSTCKCFLLFYCIHYIFV